MFGRLVRLVSLSATLAILFTISCWAADYPSKSITLVVPIAAGGNADVASRVYAKVLGEELGQTVVVENRPGASSSIGAAHVANSRADGYTLLFIGGGTITKTFIKDLTIDVLRNLTPITQVGRGDFILFVPSDLGAKTMEEFVSLVQKSPSKSNVAIVSPNQLMLFKLLNDTAKIDLKLVTYKAAVEMHQAMLRGEVIAMMDPLSTVRQHLESGKFRALMVASEKRSTFLPDVPSSSEAGYPSVQGYYTYGVWAPVNTPSEIISVLNAALHKANQSPAVKALSQQFAFELIGGSPQEMREAVEKEQKFWADAAQKVGYQAQ